MMKDYAARKVGEDSMSVLIDCEEEVAAWAKGYSGDVTSMCCWKGI